MTLTYLARGMIYPRARELPPESEKSFMARVIQYARLTGWEVHHELDSRGSSSGWPDLELVRAERHIRAELKREGERPRPDQERILALLRRTNTEVYVWDPSDWTRIIRTLGRHD
jgi:hypothetical protein